MRDGAALATLLAADLAGVLQLAPVILYTFASPVVGDAKFAGNFDNLSTASPTVTKTRRRRIRLPRTRRGWPPWRTRRTT